MFIWTALDESVDRLQRHAYVVAALLTSQQNWSSIERAWKKRLEKDGLTYFKTSEYRGLNGEFSRFKNEELYPKPTGRKAAREIYRRASAGNPPGTDPQPVTRPR